MIERPFRKAGNALIWQSIQMGGVKGIYMIRLVVLAILLQPADFGMYAIAISAAGFLLSLTNIGLIPALVQAENLDENKYNSVWSFDVTRTFLISILTIIFAPLFATVFAEPLAAPLIQVLALRPMIESLISIRVAALNRDLLFRPLALLRIVDAIVNTTVSIALAKSFGVWAMVFGAIGGAASMVIASYILAPYRPKISFQWSAVKPLLGFGWWIMLTGVVAMAGNYGLRIVISRQLGADALGIYFLAAQLAFLPSEVASEVVGGVAFPLFARIQTDLQQAVKAFRAILTSLSALLFPVCALIFVLSPVLVQDVLGAKWHDTVPLIRILVLVTMIGLLGDATIPLVKGFGQPHRITLIELVQSSSLIVMIWLFTSSFGVVGAALAWLPAIILVQFLCLFFIKDIFRSRLDDLARPLLAILLATMAGAAAATLVITFVPNIAGLVLSGLLSVLITGTILWVSDHRFSLGLVRNIAVAFPQVATFLKVQGAENI